MENLLHPKAIKLSCYLLCHCFMHMPGCVCGGPLLLLRGQLLFSACLARADMKPFTESITPERQQLNSSMETLFPVMLSEWQQHFAVFVQVSTNPVLLSALLATLHCIAVCERL